MLSIQQRQYERLAAVVEKAAKPTLLGPSHRSCKFRVQTRQGEPFELYLSGVDLDGQLLVGLGWTKEPPAVPLSELKALWHAKPSRGRLATLCAGVMLAGGVAGVVVGTVVNALAGWDGLLMGVVGGAAMGSMLAYFLQDRRPMYSWVLVYDAPAA
jgi:hypothetical protein